jgi:hypothetical protein
MFKNIMSIKSKSLAVEVLWFVTKSALTKRFIKKKIFINFIISLLTYKNKRKSADFNIILVIINRYLKMLYYILCHKTIIAPQLIKRL